MSTATQHAPQQPAEKPVPAVLDAVVAATDMRQDLLQMKMENESIMAECRVRPRDFAKMKAELLAQLEAFPELAEDSIYSKPVGKDLDTGKQKFATGLSVRAAEVLAEAYGYNRVRADITPIDDLRVKVEATFTDFQKGRIWQDGGVLSRVYKTARGGMATMPEDRFYNVIAKAEASKRVREVILRSVNAALKAWFFTECQKMQAKVLSEEKVGQIVAYFSGIGVTLEQIEALIGRPAAMGWTLQDKQTLAGIKTAIEAGESTAAEVFAVVGGGTDGKTRADDLAARLKRPATPEPASQSINPHEPAAQAAAAEVAAGPAGTTPTVADAETIAKSEMQAADYLAFVDTCVDGREPEKLSELRSRAMQDDLLTDGGRMRVVTAITKALDRLTTNAATKAKPIKGQKGMFPTAPHATEG